MSWPRLAWPRASRIATRTNSPADSGNAWPLPAHWCGGRDSSSPTSRCRRWTARATQARQATLPKIWPAALALLTSLFVVASQAYAANDTLRIRLDADARSLDPGTNRDGNTDIVQTFLFEGLVAFREDATVG